MTFDVVAKQEELRNLTSEQELYSHFDQLSRMLERGLIGKLQYEELRDLVLERIKSLSEIRKNVNGIDQSIWPVT